MFDQIYLCPRALKRQRSAPLPKERHRFLVHLAKGGLSRRGIQSIANSLLLIVRDLQLARRSGEGISRDEIRQKVDNKYRFPIAIRWLRFLGRLKEQPTSVSPYAAKIKAFADYMEHERGFTSATIRSRCRVVPRFLDQLDSAGDSLEITPEQIDEALKRMLNRGSYSRVTIQDYASAVRAFFRFAELQGWCRRGLADLIRGPRIYKQSSLPIGPSWEDVRQLLAITEGDRPIDIRDRAILMLLAIYGLRNGEVCRLRLNDFNWERELLTVAGSKTRRMRSWPLIRSVGDAVLRYLKEVRPKSSHREVFLTLRTPFRPLSCTWPIVARRLRSLSPSIPHHGPHALRHACATRLLDRGLTLEEIGDHLGHQDPDTTRIYAKVDLVGLREVADFDLGGLL